MDAATLALICAVAGGSWLLLAAWILFARLRSRTRSLPVTCATSGEWQLGEEDSELAGASEAEARMLLERGLHSQEPDVRVAAITALGNLAYRYEWAVDGLMEALAGGIESPVRVAAQLDRLAPRPGRRLTPLLEHPNDAVRFTAVRLLARYAALARLHVPDLTRDPSPKVRAGALETLRIVHSAEALRCSLELLADPHPLVRAHASRTSAAIGGPTSAPFLLPLLGDESWWVREAARKALAGFGRDAADLVAPLLESNDPALRSGAALVLQDIRVVDDLLRDGLDAGELERIVGANGPGLREATAERARWGLRLDGPPEPLTGTAS